MPLSHKARNDSEIFMLKKFIFCILSAFAISSVNADVTILQNGDVITGKVLQQDSDGVLVQMEYGTFRYPQAMVKDVRKETVSASPELHSAQRIPNWAKIISALTTNGWAHELKQI